MTDGEALVQEREVTRALSEGMEKLLCRLVALRVLLEDLHTSKVVNRLETLLVSRLDPKVRAALADQLAVIRDHPRVTTPRIDWEAVVESLVETGKGFDLSKPDEG